jgi:hypothetical protein
MKKKIRNKKVSHGLMIELMTIQLILKLKRKRKRKSSSEFDRNSKCFIKIYF